MNTQYLRYLVEIEKTGSISQAAANLYLSQPNLSKAIREMEQSLQLRILERSHHGVRFTDKGLKVLAAAKRILAEEEALKNLSQPTADHADCHIAVISDSYLYQAFTTFLANVKADDRARISYQEMSSASVLRTLKRGDASLGLIRYDEGSHRDAQRLVEEAGMKIKKQWDFEPQLVFSADSPLAQAEHIYIADLAGYSMVCNKNLLCEDSLESRFDGQINCMPHSLTLPDQRHKLDFITAELNSYIWSSPIPKRLLTQKGLLQRPCADHPFHCVDAVVCASDHIMGRLEIDFLQEITNIRRLI